MGKYVSFIAGPSDLDQIEQFSVKNGLFLIRHHEYPLKTRDTISPPRARGGWFSPVPRDEIPLYKGQPAVQVMPLINYRPSVIRGKYITIGHIVDESWRDEHVALIRPQFERIKRHIRKVWARDLKYRLPIGPHALELVCGGLEPVNFIPGTVRGALVDVKSGKQTWVDIDAPGMFERFLNKFRK